MIELQANIAGYAGRPATVFAAYDEDTGILVVAASVDLRPRRPGCVLIETETRADRDSLFAYTDLREAITAYYDLKGSVASDGRSARLRFAERAMRADPAGGIEMDGVDVTGPLYRISPDTGNAQVGALALCRYVKRYSAVADVVNMADDLNNLLSGRVVTI
ncbi:hypothetical protein [Halomonas salipaludis]|uniref:Uncharacterized protein n=1 Tax=Halomonas salipaludis TaxID=2032625 RepID=A0A2A2F3I4_9GAMM|nr:hypothetical protein [Halomonas salipaludis]PAU79217.1 hypothetical protein CK498_02280 [Halomonas salipaludis]